MTTKTVTSATKSTAERQEASGPLSATPAEKKGGMRLSMHDGVDVWCDCCSCEAEPYWIAAGENTGISSRDHEDAMSNASHKK